MQERLKGFWEKVKGFFAKLSKKVKILIIAGLAVLLTALIIVVAVNANKPYAVLFTDLSPEEITTILNYLQEQGVEDYTLEGDTILVPQEREPLLKAQLAQAGYAGSGFGYSTYYDNVGALSTEAERNTAYLLLLNERLSAVVECFDGVRSAVVTIAQGESDPYVLGSGSVTGGSAQVFVEMQNGKLLSSRQAQAIRDLVSHAVQGLEVESVVISDGLGNTYNAVSDGTVTGETSDLKLRLEEENSNLLRTNIMNALLPFYGGGHIYVSVACTVDVDISRKNITDVDLPEWADDGSTDGEGIVGTKLYDHYVIRGDEDAIGGAVGTESNADIEAYVEDLLELQGGEYEIHYGGQVDYVHDVTETYIERTSFYLADVMVAVSIDSTTAGAVNTELVRTHVARAAKITDEQAGGRISIMAAPFFREEPFTPPDIELPFGLEWWHLYVAAGALLLLALILLVIILLIARRRRKKRKQRELEEQRQRELQALMGLSAAAVVAEESAPGGADVMSMQSEKSMELRRDIRKFADESPEIAAQLIRSLLRGGEEDG